MNGFFQQLAIQGGALALAKGATPSLPVIAFVCLMFVGPHVDETATPASIATVALLSLATSLWCFRSTTPSWGAPIGFHGGWSFADTLVFGSPVMGSNKALAVLVWKGEPVESSPAAVAMLVGVVDALAAERIRRTHLGAAPTTP